MVLMIDNYDSFTYNIVQYVQELGWDISVIRNDELSVSEIAQRSPEKVIISPGPATPNEAGVSLEVVAKMQGKIPILGICLGHQAIAQSYGGNVIRAKNLMHGKTSDVEIIRGTPIFDGLPKIFRATRYHSLSVEESTLPDCIEITSKSTDDAEIMSLEIERDLVYGVQFHPESIMSMHGHKILENFLKIGD